MVPLEYYLLLSAVIFIIGIAGVLTSRNLIVIFMSVEIMLNAGNLALIAFSRSLADVSGHVFVFIVFAVAAAEAAVGLAVILAVYRNRESVNIDDFNIMRW
ncbi:MAG: NADH-quinone oxidoreductase subunit NuoK [candidate division Zixibacteria bacterium]|nr:NADH-quinone oxidoreductase subunit NuoK [candidate division Zixibacteria bacterium]MBU1471889.1 NADH-quinone oxidoreductase subunit NuoK [candidate division Zixibacteria bacterium]MBU2625585.1 NADH-quinone oxidoreductase subunit NuoK [candidate division Zixibacteria bacterium]